MAMIPLTNDHDSARSQSVLPGDAGLRAPRSVAECDAFGIVQCRTGHPLVTESMSSIFRRRRDFAAPKVSHHAA
jgi:hypothetical protein